MRHLWKFIQFGAAGIPGFVLALPLNWFLVTQAHWPKPAAYALVIAMQMCAGFLLNYYFVFKDARKTPFWAAFAQFAASMMLVRVLDWSTYTGLVELAKMPFIAAQVFCTFLFLLVKFGFAKLIFRSNSA